MMKTKDDLSEVKSPFNLHFFVTGISLNFTLLFIGVSYYNFFILSIMALPVNKQSKTSLKRPKRVEYETESTQTRGNFSSLIP